MNNHSMLPTASGMPLHCNICPKKPDFSDVSHLLTHIGSKGHLSHHFKMTLTANSDPISKRIVDQYNQWYKDWNVEDLMSERLDQKERKKSGGGSNPRRGSKVNAVSSSRSTPAPTNWAGRRSQQFRESTLDPQLGRAIKQEPKSRSGTPVSGYAMEAAAFHRSYMPPMQSWPMAPYTTTPIQHERSILDSMYSTPTSDSGETDIPARRDGCGKKHHISGSNQSLVQDEEEADFENEMNDNVKLKGIIWPGMDLFDSATPDMRRKRNQKKAHSVVRTLQATSEIVEPTELVFDTAGMLRRERPITGNPEEDDGEGPLPGESSPVSEEPPPKKKPGRRPRTALKEKDVNTGRVLRNQSRRPQFDRSQRANPYFDDQDVDDELTYRGSRRGKRSKMAVHFDGSGLEATFNNPAPFDTLTSGFRNPFQAAFTNAQASYQQESSQHGHRRQPSFPYVPRVVPSQNNPFGLLAPDFGSFTQLSGSNMAQNSTLGASNPFSMSAGSRTGVAFPPVFSMNPAAFGNDNDPFQGAAWSAAQNHNPWDFLGGFSQSDTGVLDHTDANFQIGDGDFASSTSVNPLFISGAHAAPDDDEATVSPPSERS